MDLQESLIKTGLSPKQASVYLASLQLGISGVASIAKFSETKRPTAYLVLEDLEQIGLVKKIQKGHKINYRAEEPGHILTNLKIKEEVAASLLPSLRAIYNLDHSKPDIKIAEGISGVRGVYAEIFDFLRTHPKEELLIFGSLKDAVQYFEIQVINLFYEAVAKTKNIIREIGNDDYETRKYYQTSARLNPRHEIRLIRNEGRFFQTDNMIYGNNLIIFSVKEQVFSTSIKSNNITETYRTLFNMAWASGRPL